MGLGLEVGWDQSTWEKLIPKACFIEIFIQVNSLYLCGSIYRRQTKARINKIQLQQDNPSLDLER